MNIYDHLFVLILMGAALPVLLLTLASYVLKHERRCA